MQMCLDLILDYIIIGHVPWAYLPHMILDWVYAIVDLYMCAFIIFITIVHNFGAMAKNRLHSV